MQALKELSSSSVLVPLQPQSTGDVLLGGTEVQTSQFVPCYLLHVACHSLALFYPSVSIFCPIWKTCQKNSKN